MYDILSSDKRCKEENQNMWCKKVFKAFYERKRRETRDNKMVSQVE
jgi:hypothetical protein